MASQNRKKKYKLHDSDPSSSDSEKDIVNSLGTPHIPADREEETKGNSKAMIKLEKKYSIDKYRSLLDYFRDIQVLTSKESATFISDKIRFLAEFLVFGQKYDQSIYFEEFIEENVCLRHFTRFLGFKNRQIQIQVI